MTMTIAEAMMTIAVMDHMNFRHPDWGLETERCTKNSKLSHATSLGTFSLGTSLTGLRDVSHGTSLSASIAASASSTSFA